MNIMISAGDAPSAAVVPALIPLASALREAFGLGFGCRCGPPSQALMLHIQHLRVFAVGVSQVFATSCRTFS